MKTKYKLFEKFVYRLPLLPVRKLDTTFFKSDIFNEAIYLASRDLLDAMTAEGEKDFCNYSLKLQISLLKYYLRMSTRCTPFGLFAGCGVGFFGTEEDDFVIRSTESFNTVTRLDMDFVAIICKTVTDNPEIRETLKFFPNNTLYEVGSQFRYVDYKYVDNKRSYVLSEIDTNEYITKALSISKNGVRLNDIIENLFSLGDYSKEDIKSFVTELVDSQVIISELYPNVTGEEAIARLLKFLKRPEVSIYSLNLVDFLMEIASQLSQIDKYPIGRKVEKYLQIEGLIKQIGIKYNPKYLFQSDMFINSNTTSLNDKLSNTLYETAAFLNRLSFSQVPVTLKNFKDAFYKRFEDEEIPLMTALDTDIGIGFGNLTPETAGQNNLLKNLSLESKSGLGTITITQVDYIVLQKYHEFLRNNLPEIIFTDKDVASLPENFDDLPSTMSTLVELLGYNENKEMIISMGSVGGTSASNLLTRFAQGNEKVLQLVTGIVKKEEELLTSDQLLAEIVHLPEARTGNILYRPSIRAYEIPYLALPSVDENHSIPVSDIWVSVSSSGVIKLRSKRLNKQIIPRLSSAHNFINNSLPVYHFLAMLQQDGVRPALSFNWGALIGGESYLPRVRYKNVILSPATWNIEEKDIEQLKQFDSEDHSLKMSLFIEEKKLPKMCLLCYSDNKLLIDFEDRLSVKLFLTEIIKKKKVRVEEFLFDLDSMVVKDDANQVYVNQFIFCFHKR